MKDEGNSILRLESQDLSLEKISSLMFVNLA